MRASGGRAPSPYRIGRVWDYVGVAAAVLLVVVAFWPVAFGGRTFSTFATATGVNGFVPIEGVTPIPDAYRLDKGASAWTFEPWVEINDRILDQGDLPLWNPYQGAGAPHAANMQSVVFDPLLVPANLHSSPWFRDLSILAAFMLGAAAMFALARRLGLDPFEAVVTAAAFSLTGWFFLYSNNSFGRAYIYLPILWLLIELVITSNRLLPVLGLGIAVAASVAIGMPEATFVVLALSGVYSLIRVFQVRESGVSGPLLRLAGGVTLGMALAAPLILIFLEYLPNSFSVHEAGADTGSRVDPIHGVLNLIVPFFGGEPLEGGFRGTRGWLGAGVVSLALVGLSGRRLSRQLNAFVFAALASFIILKVYNFGILAWVGELPIFERLNSPLFLLPALPFLMALLAGIGVRILRTGDLVLGRLAVLFVAVGGAVLALALSSQNSSSIAATAGTYAMRQFGLAAAIAGVILLAAVAARRWPALYIVAGLAVIIELLILAPRGIYTDRTDPFPQTASITAVQRLIVDEPQARVFGLDGKLFPNIAGAYGLSDIRVLDALYVDRYLEYVQTFLEPTVFDRFVGGPYSSQEQVFTRYHNNQMLNLLGVRLLITGSPLPAVGEADGELPPLRLRLVATAGESLIYENLDAYPRAWVVHSAHMVGDLGGAMDVFEANGQRDQGGALRVTGLDLRSEAVVEVPEATDGLSSLGGCTDPHPEDTVVIEEYDSDTVVLTVKTSCSGLLVLSDVWYPGWRATVNDRSVPIYPTNIALRGVPVESGRSLVVMTYEPASFRFGLLIAAIALLAVAVVALFLYLRGGWRPAQLAPGAEATQSPPPDQPPQPVASVPPDHE